MDLNERISSLYLDDNPSPPSQRGEPIENDDAELKVNNILAWDQEQDKEHNQDSDADENQVLDICSNSDNDDDDDDDDDDDNSINFRKRPININQRKKRFVITIDDSESSEEEEEEEEDGYASAVSEELSDSKSIHLLDTSDEEEGCSGSFLVMDKMQGNVKSTRGKHVAIKDKWANVLSSSDEEESMEDSNDDFSTASVSVESNIENPFSMTLTRPSPPQKSSHLDFSFESDTSSAAGIHMSRTSSSSSSSPRPSTETNIDTASPTSPRVSRVSNSPAKLVQEEKAKEEGSAWHCNSKTNCYTLKGPCAISGNDDWPNIQTSSKLYQKLYPHQRIGIQWLASMHCKGVGGILGDDMGLGKTMQTLGLIFGLMSTGVIQNALVVCPVNVLFNWKREALSVLQDCEGLQVNVDVLDSSVKKDYRAYRLEKYLR